VVGHFLRDIFAWAQSHQPIKSCPQFDCPQFDCPQFGCCFERHKWIVEDESIIIIMATCDGRVETINLINPN